MRQYVETGRTDGLDTGGEFPNILQSFIGPSVPQGEGTSIARAFLDGNHSLISVVARINPSPDWFIGVDSFQLCVEGNWVDTVTVEVSREFFSPFFLSLFFVFPSLHFQGIYVSFRGRKKSL